MKHRLDVDPRTDEDLRTPQHRLPIEPDPVRAPGRHRRGRFEVRTGGVTVGPGYLPKHRKAD